MIIYSFVLLCVLTEISINNTKPTEAGSFTFALLMLILCILFLAAVFVQWVFAVRKRDNAFFQMTKEPLRGVRDNRIAQLCPFLSLLKMFLVVLILSVTPNTEAGKWTKLFLILLIFGLYITYASVIRPFESWVDNAVEITVSAAITLMLVMLILLGSEGELSDTAYGFFVTIFVIALILCIIFFISKFLSILIFLSLLTVTNHCYSRSNSSIYLNV